MVVFFTIASCSLVNVCLHHQGDRSDDGGSKHLSNFCKPIPDYTAQLRRQSFSGIYAGVPKRYIHIIKLNINLLCKHVFGAFCIFRTDTTQKTRSMDKPQHFRSKTHTDTKNLIHNSLLQTERQGCMVRPYKCCHDILIRQ